MSSHSSMVKQDLREIVGLDRPMKRIAVFGGRNYRFAGFIEESLDRVLMKHGPFVLVHGDCRGADSLAADWAAGREGMVVESFPADWDKHGRAAGPLRNIQMVGSGLDGAVGFPGGAGTASIAQLCHAAGVKVWFPNDE